MFMVSLDPFGSMSLIVSLVVEETKGACPATQPRVDQGPGRLGASRSAKPLTLNPARVS